MRYTTHQGSFDFGWEVEDHTTNVLLITNPDTKEVLNVTMTRDRLEGGETLEESLQRQQKIMARSIPGYAELSRKRINIGETGLLALQLEAQGKPDGAQFSQIQTIITFPNGQDLLSLALAVPGPITEAHRQMWQSVVMSFTQPK